MKKEQVTTYQIHKDLMQCIYDETLGVIIGLPLLWILFALCIAIITLNISIDIPLLPIVTLIVVLCEILCFIYIFVMYIKIKNLKYSVKIDTLNKKQDFRPMLGKWISAKPYRLSFSNGDFDIPHQMNYKWSTMNSMDDKEIYDTASIGDTFTLVVLNRHIAVIYNNNIFEVQCS